jgi:hypothetical protein
MALKYLPTIRDGVFGAAEVGICRPRKRWYTRTLREARMFCEDVKAEALPTRSVRRASGLVQTGTSATTPAGLSARLGGQGL